MENVLRLATRAKQQGLGGAVCSTREAAPLRATLGNGFVLVTPGVRPAQAALGDQQRVRTPPGAIGAGAAYRVIGRPITAAPNPLAALEAIEDSLRAPAPLQ